MPPKKKTPPVPKDVPISAPDLTEDIGTPDEEAAQRDRRNFYKACDLVNHALIDLDEAAVHLIKARPAGEIVYEMYRQAHDHLTLLYGLLDYQYKGNT